jgi:hypothetical protein
VGRDRPGSLARYEGTRAGCCQLSSGVTGGNVAPNLSTGYPQKIPHRDGVTGRGRVAATANKTAPPGLGGGERGHRPMPGIVSLDWPWFTLGRCGVRRLWRETEIHCCPRAGRALAACCGAATFGCIESCILTIGSCSWRRQSQGEPSHRGHFGSLECPFSLTLLEWIKRGRPEVAPAERLLCLMMREADPELPRKLS